MDLKLSPREDWIHRVAGAGIIVMGVLFLLGRG